MPGLWSLDVGGGVRRTTQDGSAPTFRSLNGRLVNQSAEGDPQNITSLKFNCDLVSREAGNFQLSNGFQLGFLNLAATEIRALNSTIEYNVGLSDLFNSEGNLGSLQFDLNFYHLFVYRESATGRFDDTQESQGSVARPRNESRLTTRYINGPWTAQLTWQYNDHSKVFNAGLQPPLKRSR